MDKEEIKPGPKAKYDFASYVIGYEIKLDPLKQSSFKSMLSKFNKNLTERHKYSFEQLTKKIVAKRVK